MSDQAGYAIPVHNTAGTIDRSPDTQPVDITVPHSFWLGKQQWQTGVGRCVQASVMLGAGIFLLSQISSTPNLTVQMATVGGVFTLGGIAMLYYSLGDFCARLSIDDRGLKARLGWSGFSTEWSNVESWSVSDHKLALPELPAVKVWVSGSQKPLAIPGGHLDDKCRREIRRVFRALAFSKEADWAADGPARPHADMPINGKSKVAKLQRS